MLKDASPGLDEDRFPVDPWALREVEFSNEDLGITETLFAVGNGYLGMRSNFEEGRDAHIHGTFVNGFHETWPIQHAEQAYGFARTGQTIVNVPDTKLIKLYVDDEPLLLPDADLESYERVLDFRAGILRRRILWRSPSGKRVSISSSRMVSFTHRHLAVMTFEVELLDHDAPVVLSSQLLNRQDGEDEYHVTSAALGEGDDPRKARHFEHRVLLPQLQQADEGKLALGYRCANSGMTITCAAEHVVTTNSDYELSSSVEPDAAKTVIEAHLHPGQPLSLVKYVAYHTSRGVPVIELANRCDRTINRARTVGTSAISTEQREWLDEFWAGADIEIDGDPPLQQAIRWNLFQLAQASARSEGGGVPAKGVTGQGYEGHYFWDSEIYVVGFLAYTHPHAARELLRFRHRMLPAARQRAETMSLRGALFPWRTINGEEASAYYAAGTAQYHINADVIWALSRYMEATDDTDFLYDEGVELLIETARMWEDLGFFDDRDGQFHIHGVTGPDEYTTVVNDNLFTNAMARFNLRYAAEVVETLAEIDPSRLRRLSRKLGLAKSEAPAWRAAAAAMALPYDEGLGIHPQDDSFLRREIWDFAATPPEKYPLLLNYHPLVIYRHQVLKQADVVMALFLLGNDFTADEKRRDFDYYDPITTGDSSLSACVQSIVAAELGYRELALQYLRQSAFVDLADVHGNADYGVHVASTGGVWSALVHGFAGLRESPDGLSLEPRLPEQWERLRFVVTRHGSRLEFTIEPSQATVRLVGGPATKLRIWGNPVSVEADSPATVPGPG